MADKEFTQICKEILGIGKRLEKIEPEELRKIKADIEQISATIAAHKASFDANKEDFDGKYSGITEIIKTLDTLKAQIEEVLKSGVINDDTKGLISTFSSKKITDLFKEAMAQSDASFAKLNKDNRFTQNQMVDGYVIANHYHMKMKTQDEFFNNDCEICFRENQNVVTDNPRAFRFMSLNKLKEAINVGVAYQSESDDKYAKLKEDNRFTKNQMVDGYVVANHFHMKMKTQDEFVDGNIDICFRASQPVITDNPTPFRFMSLNKLKEAVKPQLAASFSQSGYVTLDNGLIVQWGVVGGDGEKNFPIAFPRACFMVVAGNADAQGDTGDNAFAYPISKEKFYYATKVTNVYKVIAGYPGSFIAIGW